MVLHFLIHVPQCLFHHLPGAVVIPHRFNTQHIQVTQSGSDVLCDITVIGKSREPGESTVPQLGFQQFLHGAILLAGHAVQVKQQGYVSFALAFVLCIQHPWRFLEEGRFQFLVFFEI